MATEGKRVGSQPAVGRDIWSFLVLWEESPGRKLPYPYWYREEVYRKGGCDFLFLKCHFTKEDILGFPRVLALNTFLPDFWVRLQAVRYHINMPTGLIGSSQLKMLEQYKIKGEAPTKYIGSTWLLQTAHFRLLNKNSNKKSDSKTWLLNDFITNKEDDKALTENIKNIFWK